MAGNSASWPRSPYVLASLPSCSIFGRVRTWPALRSAILRGHASGDSLDCRLRRCFAVESFGCEGQEIGALVIGRSLADDVQAVRDQRLLKLEDSVRQSERCGLAASSNGQAGSASARSTAAGLRLDQRGKRLALLLGGIGRKFAPALRRRLEIEQTAVESGLRRPAASDS